MIFEKFEVGGLQIKLSFTCHSEMTNSRPTGRVIGGYFMNNRTKDRDREITFKIHSHIGKLGFTNSGWIKEVNIVSWNQAKPRLDIRDWSPDHNKMGRGIGLSGEETENLMAIMREVDLVSLGI